MTRRSASQRRHAETDGNVGRAERFCGSQSRAPSEVRLTDSNHTREKAGMRIRLPLHRQPCFALPHRITMLHHVQTARALLRAFHSMASAPGRTRASTTRVVSVETQKDEDVETDPIDILVSPWLCAHVSHWRGVADPKNQYRCGISGALRCGSECRVGKRHQGHIRSYG